MRLAPLALLALAACVEAPSPPPQPVAAPSPSPTQSSSAAPAAPSSASPAASGLRFTATPILLPGVSGATGAVALDYLAVDRAAGRVWIPAGGTGSVDVLDVATGKLTRIEGFPTVERERDGQKRVLGPSSASLGEGVVYAGNRANSEICAIDPEKLVRGACVTLASPPDGIQYVATTKELWATTPRDRSLTILDASTPAKLAAKAKLALDGEPEGYAIDAARGLFYTNLEDADKTLVIDVRARKVTGTWEARCGKAGPRGLALDTARGLLFVACTDHVNVVDAAHGGAPLARLETGEGVDNIDYLETRGELYVAAGKAGTMTVARVGDKGALTPLATVPATPGGRVVVADRDGAAYIADGKQGRVLVLRPAR